MRMHLGAKLWVAETFQARLSAGEDRLIRRPLHVTYYLYSTFRVRTQQRTQNREFSLHSEITMKSYLRSALLHTDLPSPRRSSKKIVSVELENRRYCQFSFAYRCDIIRSKSRPPQSQDGSAPVGSSYPNSRRFPPSATVSVEHQGPDRYRMVSPLPIGVLNAGIDSTPHATSQLLERCASVQLGLLSRLHGKQLQDLSRSPNPE